MNFKIIIILAIIIGAIYLKGFYDNTQEEIIKIQNNTIADIKYIVNETVCTKIIETNVSKIKYIPQIINITMDISENQKKQIINLKPKKCFNIGCSEGYIKLKYDVFDILGYEHPKFSEKPSGGGFFENLNNHSLLVETDGFGEYIKLNSSLWYIMYDSYQRINTSIILDNKTLQNNLTLMYMELNKTRNMFTMIDLNQSNKTNEIYLRII